MHKALTWLEQSKLQEKVRLEHRHCLRLKREGWQRQEQKLGTEEVKSQEQTLQSPGDTDQVLWYCEKSEKVPVINRTADKKGTI